MTSRGTSTSSSSTIVLIVILVLTFPLWFGICAGLFGLVVGLMGGVFGIIAGIFGALIGLIALPLKVLFGWGHGGWFPHFHLHGLLFAVIIILTVLLVRKRR